MTVDIEYNRTVKCSYKERVYLVRDNGAIYRLPKDNSRPSKNDNVWTFGVKDMSTGYMFLSGIRVHQVVCTAFHGPAPSQNMVVDHIDTNRCNNRPDNLHWVTRLENALNNPVTRKKIIHLYGSVEAFLKDPSAVSSKSMPTDISWMRTVTKAEADACKVRMQEWVSKDSVSESSYTRAGIYDDILQPKTHAIVNINVNCPMQELYDYFQEQRFNPKWESRVFSHTEACLFPTVPPISILPENVISEYAKLLLPGVDYILSRYYKLVVSEIVVISEGSIIRVLAKKFGGQKNVWYVFEIKTDGKFLQHQKIGSYGKRNKALAVLNDPLARGWEDNTLGRTYHCEQKKGVIKITSVTLS